MEWSQTLVQFRDWFNSLPLETRQNIAIVLAIAVVPLLIAAFRAQPKPKAIKEQKHAPPSFLQMIESTPHSLCSGLAIIGETGCGKTSVVKLLMQELGRKAGVLWMTVKAEEPENANAILRKAGREPYVFTPGKSRFNPLAYILKHWGPYKVADFLERCDRQVSKSTGKEEAFWKSCFREGAIHSAGVLMVCRRPRFCDMYEFLKSAPLTQEQVKDAEFVNNSACMQMLFEADELAQTPNEKRIVRDAHEFIAKFLPGAGERVVGSVIVRLMGLIAPLSRGDFYETVNSDTDDVTPDSIIEGQCVVFNCPVSASSANQFLQVMFSQLFIDRLLALTPENYTVLVRDEYHLLASPETDPDAQTQLRSKKCISVSAFQGLSTLMTAMDDGMKGKHQLHELLANNATKIFMSNTDADTQSYFSTLLGKKMRTLAGGSSQMKEIGPSFNSSFNQQLLPRKLGSALTNLKRGGPDYGFKISFYLHISGRQFDGLPYKKVEIAQDLS